MNEFINVTTIAISNHDFKDERLSEATQKIVKIYLNAATYADQKNREVACILGQVSTDRSYVKDGYKSLADYANDILGMQKSRAHALATAGRFYNSDKVSAEMKAFSPFKLAEIAAIPSSTIEEAIKDGTISPTSTEKQLREFKKLTSSKPSETSVVETFTISPQLKYIPEDLALETGVNRTMEEWDDFLSTYMSCYHRDVTEAPLYCEIVKLPKGKKSPDASKATVSRTLYFTSEFSMVVAFEKFQPAFQTKPSKVETPTFTVEQLEAMLAEARANQG